MTNGARRVLSLYIVVLLILGLVHFAGAGGTTYFVRTDGDNVHTCTQAQTNDAAHAKLDPISASPCLSSGDTLHIVAGTYSGPTAHIYSPLGAVANGTTGNFTIIEGEGPTGCGRAGTCTTILNPGSSAQGSDLENASYDLIQKLVIDGTSRNADSCFRLGGTGTHVVITDVEFRNCWENGIFETSGNTFLTVSNTNLHHNARNSTNVNPAHGCYLQGTDTTFEYNWVHHNGYVAGQNSLGCQIYNSASTSLNADRAVVRFNRFEDNIRGTGILLDGANSTAYGNIVARNLSGLSIAYEGAAGTSALNNTIVGNIGDGLQVGLFHSAPVTAQVDNNLSVGNGTNINTTSVWTNSGTPASNISTGVITTYTVSATDFHLKAGSPAIDAGVNAPSVTTDFDGVFRPQGCCYDVGAYEFGSSPDTTPPASPTGVRIIP